MMWRYFYVISHATFKDVSNYRIFPCTGTTDENDLTANLKQDSFIHSIDIRHNADGITIQNTCTLVHGLKNIIGFTIVCVFM